VVVLDTDIVSYFSRLNRLRVLLDLFAAPVFVSPNVQRELQEGFQLGYEGLRPALSLIQAGTIKVLTITDAERALIPQVGLAPEKGETDSLAYCMTHGAVFVTNDKRAYHRAHRLGVQCFRLPALLRSLWMRGVLDQAGVRALIAEIETRLGIALLDQDEIFADVSD